MVEEGVQNLPDDLEGIAVRSQILINVPGLNNYEVELILLLGSNGYTSTIDAEEMNKIWDMGGITMGNETLESITEGVRGMRFKDIAVELRIEYGLARKLVDKLEQRTRYVLRLSHWNSRYFRETDRRNKEVVLTRTGTEMYERINAEVTAQRLQT